MDTEATPDAARDAVLDAALPHVPFDGWSETTFRAAVTDSGVAHGLARALFPRGGLDLAVAYHKRGDRLMAALDTPFMYAGVWLYRRFVNK